MKKLFLLLFFPALLFGQTLDGFLIAEKVYFNNSALLKWVETHIKEIRSINGETVVDVITSKEFNRTDPVVVIGGYPVQYRRFAATGNVSVNNSKITYRRIDLKAGTISKELIGYDDSRAVLQRPSDLAARVRERDSKIRNKRGGGRTSP